MTCGIKVPGGAHDLEDQFSLLAIRWRRDGLKLLVPRALTKQPLRRRWALQPILIAVGNDDPISLGIFLMGSSFTNRLSLSIRIVNDNNLGFLLVPWPLMVLARWDVWTLSRLQLETKL
jgi:hypothetical protein